jgi:hypothetical protein
MKKILAIATLLALSTASLADGINVELERDRTVAAHPVYADSVKIAPFTMVSSFKVDLQLGSQRNDTRVASNNSALSDTAEARVQRMIEVVPGLRLGARVGIGEVFNGINVANQTKDFSYYTVEPKVEYFLTKDLTLLGSYRFRNSFQENNEYLTRTWKVGFGYDVTKKDLVEVKFQRQMGDVSTSALALEYTRSF